MAKMFYTMDETKTALGKNEEEIKHLAAQGRLREFRDGAKLMFKADQVEHLKGELAGSAEPLDLTSGDSGFALSLTDEDSPPGRSGTPLGGTKSGSTLGSTAGVNASRAPADDTALAGDIGLSGSASGLPSSGKGSVSGSSLAGSAAGSRSGIDIFAGEESDKADPSAQTSIAPGINADQIAIEGGGSGSGLLDLTRESDDTSLGAELLDEMTPNASGARRPPTGEGSITGSALGASAMGQSGAGMTVSDSSSSSSRPSAPQMVEAPDPLAPAFGMACLGAALVVLFAAFALMCGLAGNHPDIIKKFGQGAPGGYNFWIVVGMSLALPALLFVTGFVLARGKK